MNFNKYTETLENKNCMLCNNTYVHETMFRCSWCCDYMCEKCKIAGKHHMISSYDEYPRHISNCIRCNELGLKASRTGRLNNMLAKFKMTRIDMYELFELYKDAPSSCIFSIERPVECDNFNDRHKCLNNPYDVPS